MTDQRDHDLGDGLSTRLDDGSGTFEDGARLHLDDAGEHDREANAAEAEHRVDLVHRFDGDEEGFLGVELVEVLFLTELDLGTQDGDFVCQLGERRQELVERRVDESDGARATFEGFEDLLEVLALEGKQFVESGVLCGLVFAGEDHALNDRSSVVAEEHVLGSAEADAFGTEFDGLEGVFGRVRVGADFELAEFVGPAHEGAEVAGHFGVFDRDLTVDDFTGGAVERDVVAFVDGDIADGEASGTGVDADV